MESKVTKDRFMTPSDTRMKSTMRTYISLSLTPLRCALILGACAALGFGLGVTHGSHWIRRWSTPNADSTPCRSIPTDTRASLTPILVPWSRGGTSTNTCPTPTGWTTRPSWRGEHGVNQSATRWVVVNASNASPVIPVSIPYVTEMGAWNDVSRHTANDPLLLSAEALVHPALLTHQHPRRVLIVSSPTSGDTLCEVLKHQTVVQVHVWAPSAAHPVACDDDPRVSTTLNSYDAWETPLYDVVILSSVPMGVVSLPSLFQACFHALKDHGIFVHQMDSIVKNRNPVDRAASRRAFTDSMQWLEQAGYATIFEYSDSSVPKSYVLALKSFEDRGRWYRNEAEINLDLATRSIPTRNGDLPFASFDGATMMQYQFTSRLVEDFWCRDNELCGDEHGHDPELVHVHISSFTVGPSTVANGGRGVFANVDIPQGATLGLDEYVHLMVAPSTAMSLMYNLMHMVDVSISNFWDVVYAGYFDGYGFFDANYGPMALSVEPGIWSFVNHGCNGTYNIGEVYNDTEITVDFGVGPVRIQSDRRAFDPRLSRYFPSTPDDVSTALYNIEAGSEILDNYLVFGGDQVLENWDVNLKELKTMCTGGSGTISKYEDTIQ